MQDDNHSHLDNIPDDFHELGKNDFVKNCKVCNKYLPSEGNHYLLEKAVQKFPDVKAEETVFEYAICIDCASSKRETLSKESKEKIETYFQNIVKREEFSDLIQNQLETGTRSLDFCIITGKSINEVNEYQIIANCLGNKLFPGSMALMISGKGLEAINELLSESTKDELDKFRDDYFGVPPEFEKLFNPSDLILC